MTKDEAQDVRNLAMQVGNPLLRATLLASLPDTDAGAHYLDPINEEDVKVMRDRISRPHRWKPQVGVDRGRHSVVDRLCKLPRRK